MSGRLRDSPSVYVYMYVCMYVSMHVCMMWGLVGVCLFFVWKVWAAHQALPQKQLLARNGVKCTWPGVQARCGAWSMQEAGGPPQVSQRPPCKYLQDACQGSRPGPGPLQQALRCVSAGSARLLKSAPGGFVGLWEGQRKMFSHPLFSVSQALVGRLGLRSALGSSAARRAGASPPESRRDLGQAAAANGGN